MKITEGFASLALALCATAAANAANITWRAPVNETGTASDILTSGALVESATTGSTTTEGGVTFQGQTGYADGVISFGASAVTVSDAQVNVAVLGTAPDTWDGAYQALVGQGTYTSTASGPMVINLSGLTSGETYDVQIFEAFWNINWDPNFTGGTNTSHNVKLTGLDIGVGASSVPQYLLGSFTASGTTQTIVMGSPTDYEVFDAIQLRTAVPEPAAWALMILGVVFVGGALRAAPRGRTARLSS